MNLTMLLQLLSVALAATISSATPLGNPISHPKDSCFDFFVDVPVETVTYTPLFPPFKNQYEATEKLLQTTSRTAPNATSVLSGPKPLSTTIKIGATYCTPAGQEYDQGYDTVLVLSHGLGFDRR